MVPRPIVIRGFFPGMLASGAFLVFVLPLCAQRPPSGAPGAGQRSAAPSATAMNSIDVRVSVREPSGAPLAGNAFVKLTTAGGMNLTVPTQDNSTATFPQILAGEYEIEVTAPGYKTAEEHASIFAGGTTCTVYVYLHSKSEGSSGNVGSSEVLMTPRLQGEIDKGLDKMRRHQYDAARAQFEKAAKMAPGNPDIQYLLGMLEYTQEHFDAARGKFQAALSINPSHERS